MKLTPIDDRSIKGVIDRMKAVTTIVVPILWYQLKSESIWPPCKIGIQKDLGPFSSNYNNLECLVPVNKSTIAPLRY